MERRILELVATDRIEIPLSSMDQKLRRTRLSLGSEISDAIGDRYVGERVFARVVDEDKERARGMKEAIAEFEQEFPKYGAVLRGKIAEKRITRERHLYFGVNEGKRLSSDDYMSVMQSIGLTPAVANALYPDLMEVSRKLAKARQEERSVIVGKYEEEWIFSSFLFF